MSDFLAPPGITAAGLDAAAASRANDPASQLRGALNATFVPRWLPNTAYAAGTKVVSPVGDIVSAKVDFTSGASYDAANWNISATFADTPAASIDSTEALNIYKKGATGIAGWTTPNEIVAKAMGWVICKGTTRAQVIAALDAAEAKGRHTIVWFPPGVYDLLNGLSLSGYSVQIRGAGAGGTQASPTGTVFTASTQTGPVLDFTGWIIPTDVFTARVRFEGFMVRGSGVADATKNNAGIRLKVMSSATFCDIAIRDTGGPCLEGVTNPGNAVYLCDFERIILNTPVGAKVNDVPWMIMDEPNGNRFRSFGLRSMSSSADVGVSGAVRITSNATYPSYQNTYDSWWFENLHIPNGGTIFAAQCHTSDFLNFGWHDIQKESGATGTSYMRFTAPTAGDYGGNTISGLIPGSDGTATQPDMGIDMRQSRNKVMGVKGYKGKNVTLASGVTDTHVYLSGAMSSATDPAIVDNSGSLTNSWVDRHLNIEVMANRVGRDTLNLESALNRFYDTATPNNGGVAFGKSGARIQSIGGSGALWYTPASGQVNIFTDGALAEVFRTLANGLGLALATGKHLKFAGNTTAARQPAATVGAGAVQFDTTLGFLIYSDGTNWKKVGTDAVV